LICSKRERSLLTSSTSLSISGAPRRRRALADGDQRSDVRSPVADDERLRDERMRLERVLEVLRRDVLPARGDEDVLLAVGDREEAVLVEVADVAGAQPASPGSTSCVACSSLK
jgi:hypothetical protein